MYTRIFDKFPACQISERASLLRKLYTTSPFVLKVSSVRGSEIYYRDPDEGKFHRPLYIEIKYVLIFIYVLNTEILR